MVARAGTDLFRNSRLRSMFDAPLRMMMPNGRLPAFNDSHETSALGSVLYESAFTHWGDLNYAWARDKSNRRDWQSLLFGVPELPKPDAPVLQSFDFTATGIAVLRAGAGPERTYLALDYGPHGGGHGHPDKLSFVFYGLERTLALDPGCVSYGLKIHSQWYKQTVSHNTILVGEQSQEPCTGQCTYFATGPSVGAVQATADRAYEDVKMARTALLTDRYLVLLDELASDDPETYDWAYHDYGTLAVDPSVSLTGQEEPLGTEAGYQYLTGVQRAKTNKPWGATWTLDEKTGQRVRLDMLAPATEEVITALGPGVSPSEKVPALLVRRQAKSTVYAAVLQPGTGPTPLACRRLTPITAKQAALEIQQDQNRDVMLVAMGRQRVQCLAGSGEGAVSANARLAWFSFQPERTRALLVDGRSLTSRTLSLDVNPATTLYAESMPGRLRLEHQGREAAGLYLGLSRELLGAGGQIQIVRLDPAGKTLATVRPDMRRGKLEIKIEPQSVYEVRIGQPSTP